MMIAAQCTGPQQPLTLAQMPIPEPGAGEALLRLSHAALNRRDWWIQQGQYANLRYPIVLGSDGCGRVEAVGSGVSPEWMDKRVVVNPGFGWGSNPAYHSKDFTILGLPKDGTLAQYVVVPVSHLYHAPAHLTDAQAAALPLAGLTGYRALFTKGQLQPGDTVLITGIGGGVALMMLQMAVAAGAEVFVTSGDDEKIDRAVALGAKLGVNYNMSGWHKLLQQASNGFDLMVDSAGGEGFRHFVDLAKPGGRIVFFGGTQGAINGLNPQKMYWKQLQLLGTTMGTPEEFGQMLNLFADEQIVPVVDEVFPLDRVNDAFDTLGRSSQFGKLVVAINP
jgi:NADPH:quinone reductase-like Zn-dependent oxidoreductase